MTSRISWGIEVDGIEGGESVILTRETTVTQVQQAVDLCVGGLTSYFNLTRDAQDGIYDKFLYARAKLVSGSEGDFDQRTELPVGELISNVVDLRTRQPIVRTGCDPEIRVSIESISQEASNLLSTARLFSTTDTSVGLSESTLETIGQMIDDRQLLVDSATRIAAARRMLRYVILPNGSLDPDQLRNLGFDTWLEEQFTRRAGKKVATNKREAIHDNYEEAGIALKNLRRSAWTPLFFKNLGIDPSEVVFYMAYRDILSRNADQTVTFSSALTTVLKFPEARRALEEIFNPKKPKSVSRTDR